MKRAPWLPFVISLLALLAFLPAAADAWQQYSTDKNTDNCAACHGNFRISPYISQVDGQSWNDDLHDVHRNTMLGGDCNVCHYGSGKFPVYLNRSNGGSGLAAISCAGCHGRAEDEASPAAAYGAGLRQHHNKSGVTSCASCHSDASPANYTPVGENVKPPYYANPGTSHPNMPTDPCSPAGQENFAASLLGLDNDGDGLFDGSDTNCQTAPPVTLNGISISGPASVNEGGTATYTATGSYSDGSSQAVSAAWSVSPTTYATIGSSSGILTALSVASTQTVTVTASFGGKTATKSVSIVDVPATLNGISISGPASVNEGGTATYTATGSYSDGSSQAVSAAWSVSPTTYATIGSSSGILTALSVTSTQTVTVTASFGGKTAANSVGIVDVPEDPTDTTPPTVISTNPLDGAVDVPVTPAIEATFSEQMDRYSLESGNIRLRDAQNIEVPGTVSYNEDTRTAAFSPSAPLAYGTAYTAEVKAGAQDLAGNRIAAPYKWTFATAQSSPDSDGDGVGDGEDDYPHDCRNATPKTPRGSGKIRVELSGSTLGCLKNVKTSPETGTSVNQAGMPDGYEFPDGLVYYEVGGIQYGSTETVILTRSQAFAEGSKVFKVDESGFQEFLGGTIRGDSVTLTVTDGGAGDSDGMADGVITDPVGVAVPVAGGGGSVDLSTSGAGGGCSVAGRSGGWGDAAGSCTLLFLPWLGLVLLRKWTSVGGR